MSNTYANNHRLSIIKLSDGTQSIRLSGITIESDSKRGALEDLARDLRATALEIDALARKARS